MKTNLKCYFNISFPEYFSDSPYMFLCVHECSSFSVLTVSLLFSFVFWGFVLFAVVCWSCYLHWQLMWCVAECFVKWSRFLDSKIIETQFAATIHQRHIRRRHMEYTLQVQCHMETLGLLNWMYFIKIFSIIWCICSFDMGFIFLNYLFF